MLITPDFVNFAIYGLYLLVPYEFIKTDFYCISKLTSCLEATREARPILSQNVRVTIYPSLMQSQINYYIETWGSWE